MMPINPLGCTDVYAPVFYLGKHGSMTAFKMPDRDYSRTGSDGYSLHSLLEGVAASRSPYLTRVWGFQFTWLYPDVSSMLYEYATRQRGVGPFVFHDPHTKNKLTANQASGTDSLLSTDGFSVSGFGDELSSSTAWSQQGERSLLWQFVLPNTSVNTREVYDTFDNRTASSGWGTAEFGDAWTNSGGASSDFSVVTGSGNILMTSANVARNVVLADTYTDTDSSVIVSVPQLATGASIQMGLIARRIDSNNFYHLMVQFNTDGTLGIRLIERTAGTDATLDEVTNTGYTYAANTQVRIRFRAEGSLLQGKVWVASGAEPEAWQVSAVDTTLTSGLIGVRVIRTTSNTNTNVTLSYLIFEAVVPEADRTLTLVAPTGYNGWLTPSGTSWAFSGYVRASGAANLSVYPKMTWLSSSGSVLSTVTGAAINVVTGSASSFCITGNAPSDAAVSLSFIASASGDVVNGSGIFFDQMQLEMNSTCTTWEYGDGQPLVSVRVSDESVPRIRRGTLSYEMVEVTP